MRRWQSLAREGAWTASSGVGEAIIEEVEGVPVEDAGRAEQGNHQKEAMLSHEENGGSSGGQLRLECGVRGAGAAPGWSSILQ